MPSNIGRGPVEPRYEQNVVYRLEPPSPLLQLVLIFCLIILYRANAHKQPNADPEVLEAERHIIGLSIGFVFNVKVAQKGGAHLDTPDNYQFQESDMSSLDQHCYVFVFPFPVINSSRAKTFQATLL